MDKLLIEFAEKAGFYVEGDKVFCDSFDSIDKQLERFAEMIIDKCGELVDDGVDHGSPSIYIDRYFGV